VRRDAEDHSNLNHRLAPRLITHPEGSNHASTQQSSPPHSTRACSVRHTAGFRSCSTSYGLSAFQLFSCHDLARRKSWNGSCAHQIKREDHSLECRDIAPGIGGEVIMKGVYQHRIPNPARTIRFRDYVSRTTRVSIALSRYAYRAGPRTLKSKAHQAPFPGAFSCLSFYHGGRCGQPLGWPVLGPVFATRTCPPPKPRTEVADSITTKESNS